MLSKCFHFGVFEIFVPNLFLLPFLSFQYICVSVTYEQSAVFEEEYYDITRIQQIQNKASYIQ